MTQAEINKLIHRLSTNEMEVNVFIDEFKQMLSTLQNNVIEIVQSMGPTGSTTAPQLSNFIWLVFVRSFLQEKKRKEETMLKDIEWFINDWNHPVSSFSFVSIHNGFVVALKTSFKTIQQMNLKNINDLFT